ncbi:MAG TPA: PKD domain-containing protein [Steroidobacteraceae bacterium]|nr:PKD domain-containing protein [Steroidobacteraceae bacterium]
MKQILNFRPGIAPFFLCLVALSWSTLPTPAWANTAPTASFDASATSGTAPLTVMFKGQSSKDPDGRVVDYRWNIGGTNANGPVAKHVFTQPGDFVVTLTVTDNRGASDTSAPVTIRILGDTTAPAPTDPVEPPPSNTAPTISGTPSTSVNSGMSYSFQPSASDADGDSLAFSIQNKPAWAAFSSSTGRLSGTPSAADVGQYSNILISVSDGAASASLAGFAIDVVAVANGSVTLSWTPPTQNTDGSALTDLAGYRIGYGTSATALNTVVELMNPGLTSAVIESLTSGTWYFAVKAVNGAGVESDYSSVASKAVP